MCVRLKPQTSPPNRQKHRESQAADHTFYLRDRVDTQLNRLHYIPVFSLLRSFVSECQMMDSKVGAVWKLRMFRTLLLFYAICRHRALQGSSSGPPWEFPTSVTSWSVSNNAYFSVLFSVFVLDCALADLCPCSACLPGVLGLKDFVQLFKSSSLCLHLHRRGCCQ